MDEDFIPVFMEKQEMKRKRILLVRSTPNDLDVDGYNVQQLGLGKAFVNLGYDYDFITFKKDKSKCRDFVFYHKNGYTARCIEKPRYRILRWGINTAISKKEFLNQYDLVICQEYYQIESFLIARNSNKVALYSGPYYNLFLPKFISPLYDRIIGPKLNKLVKVIFVKSVLAYNFLQNKGYTGLKNVGVALDTLRFDDVDIKPNVAKLVNYMVSNKCILYVGAISDRKNYPFMLRVYQKLLEKDPSLKFIVIGRSNSSFWHKLFGGKDADYEINVNKKIPQYVKDGILRIERIENPQLKYIYPRAGAFLLPSKLEIFGMVLLEAMYLGAAVVSSSNGGSKTLIGDNDNLGQIVEEFDVKKWAEAVMRYITDNRYSDTVRANAQLHIKNNYTWNVIAENMLKHLKNNGYDI